MITHSIFTIGKSRVPSLPPTTKDFLLMEPAERERLSACAQTKLDLQRLWLLHHQPDDIARKCGQLMLGGHTLAHERQEMGRNYPLGSQLCPPQGCGQLSDAPRCVRPLPSPLPSLRRRRPCTARALHMHAVPADCFLGNQATVPPCLTPPPLSSAGVIIRSTRSRGSSCSLGRADLACHSGTQQPLHPNISSDTHHFWISCSQPSLPTLP